MAYYRVTKKQEGGGSTEPKIVYATSASRQYSLPTLSYTFTESGTFQYYIFINPRSGSIVSTDLTVSFNGSTINPTFYSAGAGFFYGELNVSVGDVISTTPVNTNSDTGVQLFVMQNCDISAFSVVGTASNTNATFAISLGGKPYLQVFQCSFYSGSNLFKYGIMNYVGQSIAVPKNESTYYYGFTYVIQLVASNNRGLAKSGEEQEDTKEKNLDELELKEELKDKVIEEEVKEEKNNVQVYEED